MSGRTLLLMLIWLLHSYDGRSQDMGIWAIDGSLQKNALNPGAALNKKFNIAPGNYNLNLSTDGPAIHSITSVNAQGNRYLDFSRFGSAFNDVNNISLQSKLQSIGLAYKIGDLTLLAGHSFNVSGVMSYTGALANLAAKGNAAFIGQTLEIGPSFNLFAYNELYAGFQKQHGKLGIGARVKFLFGTAGVESERHSILFTTDQEFYQLRFQNDYLIRSSSLFNINTIDDIDFSYPDFTFENLFYNNFGLAFDLGATLQLTEKTEISFSLLDVGKIKWDFFPKAFSSEGSFSFDGIDIIRYISDSTGISISDTLINLFSFKETSQIFTTVLPSCMFAGISHKYNELWTFHALMRVDMMDLQARSAFSLGAFRKFGIINLGMNYTIRKNNYSSIGLNANGKIGPVMLYLITDNIPAWFRPLHFKSFNIGFGAGISF